MPDGFKIHQMFTFGHRLSYSPAVRSAQQLGITETDDALRSGTAETLQE